MATYSKVYRSKSDGVTPNRSNTAYERAFSSSSMRRLIVPIFAPCNYVCDYRLALAHPPRKNRARVPKTSHIQQKHAAETVAQAATFRFLALLTRWRGEVWTSVEVGQR